MGEPLGGFQRSRRWLFSELDSVCRRQFTQAGHVLANALLDPIENSVD